MAASDAGRCSCIGTLNRVVPAGPLRFGSAVTEGKQRVEISLRGPGDDGWAGKLPGTRFLSSSIAAVPVTAQPASALGH